MTAERTNDSWAQPRTSGRSDDLPAVPNTLMIMANGPWRAMLCKVVTTTPKGNRSTKKVAVLELHRPKVVHRYRSEPPGHLGTLQDLAKQLNGWEQGRYFAPGKPETWRMQNSLPPEKPF